MFKASVEGDNFTLTDLVLHEPKDGASPFDPDSTPPAEVVTVFSVPRVDLAKYVVLAEESAMRGSQSFGLKLRMSEPGQVLGVPVFGLDIDEVFKDAAGFIAVDTIFSYEMPKEVFYGESVVSRGEYLRNLFTQALQDGLPGKEPDTLLVHYKGDMPESPNWGRKATVFLRHAFVAADAVKRVEDQGAFRTLHIKGRSFGQPVFPIHTTRSKEDLDEAFGLTR